MGSNAPGPRRPISDVIRQEVEGYVRGAELSAMMGRQNASADAQRTSDGIGIQNVRRGVARASLAGLGANITVSATSYAALTTPLELTMFLSGRPLRITLTGLMKAGVGAALAVDVLLRDVSVAGRADGLAYSEANIVIPFTGTDVVMSPAAGVATLSVVAKRVTANGTLYVDSLNRLVLMAEEL